MKSVREIRHPATEGIKLASLMHDGIKVCLVFPHGMGDIVMFRPVLNKLRDDYPNATIHMMTKSTLKELDDHDEDMVYDVSFWLDYTVATSGHPGFTKNTLCCANELGIQPPMDDLPIAKGGFRSPWVGVGCTSISMPHYQPTAYECSEVNRGILDAGLIPLDLSFNTGDYAFPPVSPMACDVRKVRGNYAMLAGAVERCFAFIGTFTGSFHVAQSLLPGRTLLLCPRAMEWQRLFRREPLCVNMRDITAKAITDWLKSLP